MLHQSVVPIKQLILAATDENTTVECLACYLPKYAGLLRYEKILLPMPNRYGSRYKAEPQQHEAQAIVAPSVPVALSTLAQQRTHTGAEQFRKRNLDLWRRMLTADELCEQWEKLR